MINGLAWSAVVGNNHECHQKTCKIDRQKVRKKKTQKLKKKEKKKLKPFKQIVLVETNNVASGKKQVLLKDLNSKFTCDGQRMKEKKAKERQQQGQKQNCQFRVACNMLSNCNLANRADVN